MAQQCRCGWPTTDDTAAALTALSAYAATERLVPSTATATVGGPTVATRAVRLDGVVADGDGAASQRCKGRRSSSRGETVHYTVLYTYPVPPDAPGRARGFPRGAHAERSVESGVDATPARPLATMDLRAAKPV